MHEGGHGILDGVEDMDEVFGKKKNPEHDHNHDDHSDHDHSHEGCCKPHTKKTGFFKKLFKKNK